MGRGGCSSELGGKPRGIDVDQFVEMMDIYQVSPLSTGGQGSHTPFWDWGPGPWNWEK